MMKYSLPGVPVKPLKATQSKLIAFCEAFLLASPDILMTEVFAPRPSTKKPLSANTLA